LDWSSQWYRKRKSVSGPQRITGRFEVFSARLRKKWPTQFAEKQPSNVRWAHSARFDWANGSQRPFCHLGRSGDAQKKSRKIWTVHRWHRTVRSA
jgi:hypothetical protein